MRWPIGIVLFFAVIFVVNMAFIYIAVTGADPVVESYQTVQHR